MELGVALLWLRKYAEAWEHFRSVIETNPRCGDNDYGMAGVAKWCLDQRAEAVLEWKAGLEAKYARAAGLNLQMPLLLFFAAILQPTVFERNSAEKLIREKTRDLRIKNWPGPIARLVVDQIGESEFHELCQGANEQGRGNRFWLTEFYTSLMIYEPSKHSDFRERMRRLADTSQPECQDEAVLLRRLWHEEFFLARFVAQKTDGNQ